jgi:prepilin-type N-terminal cleavage/methylation domain-containing protein
VINVKQRGIPESQLDDGFTLMELLIVVVVLGILASIAILAVASFQNDANAAACTHDRRALQSALAAYQGQHAGALPSRLDVLERGTPSYLQGTRISGDEYTGKGFTLTYTVITGELNDCEAALSAGGPSTGSPSPSPSPAPGSVVVSTCTPSSVAKHGTRIVTIAGSNFATDAEATLANGQNGAITSSYVSPTAMTLTVVIGSPNAVTGPRTVQVTNPTTGVSASLTACFTVT